MNITVMRDRDLSSIKKTIHLLSLVFIMDQIAGAKEMETKNVVDVNL